MVLFIKTVAKKKRLSFISDSELNGECIDFTMVCAFIASVILIHDNK